VSLRGIHVEVLRGVALAPVAIRPDEALALLAELRGAVRGAPADRPILANQIAEIGLTPVIDHPEGQGLTIVDALIAKMLSHELTEPQ
jgi:acetate---CoA ligase (ADP-forming)